MKPILIGISLAGALLANLEMKYPGEYGNETLGHSFWPAACGGTRTQTQSEQHLLIAAGFKVVTPKTTMQQHKLQSLPPGQLAMISKGGQTYYVFPDAANNRALVGGPTQYQSYLNYRPSHHLAAEQLVTSPAYADASLGWDAWNGWPGTYGH